MSYGIVTDGSTNIFPSPQVMLWLTYSYTWMTRYPSLILIETFLDNSAFVWNNFTRTNDIHCAKKDVSRRFSSWCEVYHNCMQAFCVSQAHDLSVWRYHYILKLGRTWRSIENLISHSVQVKVAIGYVKVPFALSHTWTILIMLDVYINNYFLELSQTIAY